MTEKVVAPGVPPSFKNVKAVTTATRITFDFAVENAPETLTSFKIAYGKDADSLSQEVVTLPINKIASKTLSGAYSWYIDKIPEGTYTFKIFGRAQDGSLINGFVSEPVVATIGKEGCTIGNVGALQVITDDTKSIISWDALSGAVSYNVYKVSPAGDYALVQNTNSPTYTLFLSS